MKELLSRHSLRAAGLALTAVWLGLGCADETRLFPAQIPMTARLKCECGLVTAFRDGEGKVPTICEVPRSQNVGQWITRLDEQGECVLHQITEADVLAAEEYDRTDGRLGSLLCGTADCPVRDTNNQVVARNFLDSLDEERWQNALDECFFLDTGLTCVSMIGDEVGPPSSTTWISKEEKCERLCAARSSRITVRQCDARALGLGRDACDQSLERAIQVDIQCGAVTRATKLENQCVGETAQSDPPLILLAVDPLTSTANIIDDDGDSLATPSVSGTMLVSRDRCPSAICPFQILNLALEVSDFQIGDEVSRHNAISFERPIAGTLDAGGDLLFLGSSSEVWVRGTLDSDGFAREGPFQMVPFALGGIHDQAGTLALTLSIASPELEMGAILSLHADFVSRPPRPAFTAPATAACVDGGAWVTADASATTDPDGLGDLVERTWRVDGVPTRVDAAGRIFVPYGPRTLSLETTDRNNLRAVAEASIEVSDRVPPRIACPAPVVAECSDDGTAFVEVPHATATDNCGIASLTVNKRRHYSLGTTNLSYTAVDHYGYKDTCFSSVTVEDNRPPELAAAGKGDVCLLYKPQKEKYLVLRADPSFYRLGFDDACDPSFKVRVLGATDARGALELAVNEDRVCVEANPKGTFELRLGALDRSGNAADFTLPVKLVELQPVVECKSIAPETTPAVTLAGQRVEVMAAVARGASGGRSLEVEFSSPVLVRSVAAEDRAGRLLRPRLRGFDRADTLVSTLGAAPREGMTLRELRAIDNPVHRLEVDLEPGATVATLTLCKETYDYGAVIASSRCAAVLEARESAEEGDAVCRTRGPLLP